MKKTIELNFVKKLDENLKLETGVLQLILGPRQVGKTTTILKYFQEKYEGKFFYTTADDVLNANHDWIIAQWEYAKRERKILILDEIQKCFYLSCEEIDNYKSLIELLRSMKGYDVILLDEICFVDEWSRAIKLAIDSGWTKIIVVTGSHAHDLKLGSDRMPGRFDGGGEFTLLPMDFEEFCVARKIAGWSSSNRLEELRAYFKIGGFPTAVAEAGASGVFPRKSMETYWKWLLGDVIKLGKNEEFLTELLIQLASVMQTPVSFTTLAKKANLGSQHNTAADYISILESCFALKSLYAVDIDSGGYRMRKDRKFYFRDPILFWLAHPLSGKKPPMDAETKLAEMVANEHLTRV